MNIEHAAQEFCDYSSYIKGYAITTIQRYRDAIQYLQRQTKITDTEEVTETLMRQLFLDGRIKRKWSPSSFITYHKSYTVFFRWCLKKGYMETNFMDDIELPKKPKRLPKKYTRQEALYILEVAYNLPYQSKFLRYRNHAIFSMFLYAGLRKQELLNLNYTDVDLENMSIFIRQGKGAKDRVVPICESLAGILRKYLVERKRMNRTCPNFFTSYNVNNGLTVNGLKHLTEKMRKAARMAISPHRLRHTFATLMVEGGCDIFSLSKMMGHSDIKTTTIYLSATAEHLRNQITKHPLN